MFPFLIYSRSKLIDWFPLKLVPYENSMFNQLCYITANIYLLIIRKYIRLGEYNTEDDIDCIYLSDDEKQCAEVPMNIGVAEIMVPRYDVFSFVNDIALVRLERKVPFSSFIKPICLPRNAEDSGLEPGNKLTVAGWGQTDLCKKKTNRIIPI